MSAVDVACAPDPEWRIRFEWRQRCLFATAVFLAVTGAPLVSMPSSVVQWSGLAIGVLLLGVPHGAVDPWVVFDREDMPAPTVVWVGFLTIYLMIGLGVLALWSHAPLISLAGFLAISAWHFGSVDMATDETPGPLGRVGEALTRGATPILVPVILSPEETIRLLELLSQASLSPFLDTLSGCSLLFGWAAVRLFSWIHRAFHGVEDRIRTKVAALIGEIATWMSFAFLPVPIAFFLTFCLDHSARHTIRLAARFDSRSPYLGFTSFARRAFPGTLIVGAIGIAAAAVETTTPTDERLPGIVFIGLAALTVPHVLLGTTRRR